jgi:hypothetical protein
MGKSSQFLMVGLAIMLAFASGLLLGGGMETAGSTNTVDRYLSAEDMRAILHDELRGLRLAETDAVTQGTSRSAESLAATHGTSSGRTPSWDALIQRINAAAERLERAAALAERGAKPTVADQVALARAGTFPQNTYAIKEYCNRLENAEEDDWDKVYGEIMFLAPNQILARFGEPTEITLEVGSMLWDYRSSFSTDLDEKYYWELSITFTDGAVMDVEVDYYDE